MDYKTHNDRDHAILAVQRAFCRAKEAATAAAHLRKLAKLTEGDLRDVSLTTAALETADRAFNILLEAAADVSIAKRSLECSTHTLKFDKREENE